MQSLFQEEEDDVFFDSYDHTSAPLVSVFENSEPRYREFGLDFCEIDSMSVSERRERFLRAMGLDDLFSTKPGCSARPEDPLCDQLQELEVSQRIAKHSDSMSDLSNSDEDRGEENSDLKEDAVDTETLMTLPEFELSVRQSHPVQQLMQKAATSHGKVLHRNLHVCDKKPKSWWWRSFLSNNNPKRVLRMHDAPVKDCKLRKAMCMRTYSSWKSRQGIQAHNGLIRVIKFSPSGSFLASGGEDGVIRIWKMIEVENSCRCCAADGFPQAVDKDCKIEEKPIHEFRGHSGKILDLSWSKSDCLLSASNDKTVRLWKIGCNECQKVFEHNDYVTCVQYNPVDDRYLISGSIDGKVRIWGVAENRVVNWVDIRDIVTAVSYQPDGKGFIVGCIKGVCHFYDCSENSMQLHKKLSAQGRKKSAGKRITSIEFSPGNSERLMITSADSKVQIFRRVNLIHILKGPWNSKIQSSASFTSDGNHIVSVSKDSTVYLSSTINRGKSIKSRKLLSSDGVSLAVPWPDTSHSASITALHDSSPKTTAKPSKRSSTWPEELLPKPPKSFDHHRHLGTENPVIVTASYDGVIKVFC